MANGIESKYILKSDITIFLYSHLFIASEVVDPDFPIRLLSTKKLQTYHGMGVTQIIKHKKILERFDYHFALGEHYKQELSKLSNIKTFDIGFSKVDNLKNRSCPIFPTSKRYPKTILYMPHWHHSSSIHKILDNIDILLELNIFLIILPHNYLFKKYKDNNYHQKLLNLSKKNNRIIYIEYANSQNFYTMSDILLTDCYTTAIYEFSILEKPIITLNDKNWFDEHQNYNIDIEKDFLNAIFTVSDIKEVKSLISNILNNNIVSELKLKQKIQKNLVKKYFYHLYNASDYAINIIKKISMNQNF
jgi:hypothetical protein